MSKETTLGHGWPVAKPISTERTLLEPIKPEHAAEMVSVLASEGLYRYIGGQGPTEQALAERYERQSIGQSPDGQHGWLNWIIRLKLSEAAIGFVQATLTKADAGINADLAWLVAPERQGSGLATEAASAMCAWLRVQGVEQLSANIHPENAASAGVARKLGFRPTARVIDGEVCWEPATVAT